MNANHVILIGFVGRIGFLRYFEDGKMAIDVRLGTTEGYKSRQTGEWVEHTDWHNLEFRDRDAECIANHLDVGQELSVTGKLRCRTYEKDGVPHPRYYVEVQSFQFGRRAKPKGEHAGLRPRARQPSAEGSEPPAVTATAAAHEEASEVVSRQTLCGGKSPIHRTGRLPRALRRPQA